MMGFYLSRYYFHEPPTSVIDNRKFPREQSQRIMTAFLLLDPGGSDPYHRVLWQALFVETQSSKVHHGEVVR
jgi:hypothetical protein